MQTFFNPTTPFIDDEGRPMVGARVSFMDLETSASLITITDFEGTPLENPLFTGDDGRIRLQNGNGAPAVPCVADGLSYKVVVEKRTGVDPVYIGGILQNPEELYEAPFIAFVVTSMNKTEQEGNTTVVGSIADVRVADPELGSVLCSGYYDAGDCPARAFTWIDSVNPPQDNGIDVLRNPENGLGYWKMESPDGGVWDVRIAGMRTDNSVTDNAQCLTALLNIVNGLGTDAHTVYFPAGEWYLNGGFSCASLIMEKDSHFLPYGDHTYTVTIEHLENRGGKFHAYDPDEASSGRIVPKLTGVFRTSWCVGTINEFMANNSLENVRVLVFDNDVTAGELGRSLTGKLVIIKGVIPVAADIDFNGSVVIDLVHNRIQSKALDIGEFTIVYEDDDSVGFYIGSTKFIELNSEDKVKVSDLLVEGTLTATSVECESVESDSVSLKTLKMDTTSNPLYIASNVDVDLTSFGTAGEFAVVENTKENAQIMVVVNRNTLYDPTPYHRDFPVNAGNGVLLLCTKSYDETSAVPPSSWIPLTANVILRKVDDE